LGVIETVIGETPLLLQVEDERSYLVVADPGGIGVYAL
jgi:hypothetical protein